MAGESLDALDEREAWIAVVDELLSQLPVDRRGPVPREDLFKQMSRATLQETLTQPGPFRLKRVERFVEEWSEGDARDRFQALQRALGRVGFAIVRTR